MAGLDLQQLELIFYVLLGVIAFTLAVLIVYVVASNRRERAKLAEAYRLDSLAPRPALRVAGQILALLRDEPGEPLQVEINRKRYKLFSEIEDRQVRRQVIEAAMELIQFTGVLGNGEMELAPMEKTYHWREDIRDGSKTELSRIHDPNTDDEQDDVPSQNSADVEEQFLSLLAEMGRVPSSSEKPSLVNAIQARWLSNLEDQGPPRTFIDEIDAIVQRRLQWIPALAQKELHIQPGPSGEVRFTFEGKEYEHVDDIPNLTACQVVRDAIEEWDETT
ncbi:MAG: hypothetical protein ACP5JJ_04615 [Anaerolineae bacterium]